MRPLRPDTLLSRSPGPLSADLHDETVLMSLESGSYYGLEGTARRIWELLATPCTLSDLGERLAMEYHVDPGQCVAEILPFIEEMRRERLLVAEP